VVGDGLGDGAGEAIGDVEVVVEGVERGQGSDEAAGFVVAGASLGEILLGIACAEVTSGDDAVEIVRGALLGLGGDIALVAGDAAEAPEDEGDALGEDVLEVDGGSETGDGLGAMLLPLVGVFGAGDDGAAGAEAVTGVVAAGDSLAGARAWAGGVLSVAAIGVDLGVSGHGGRPPSWKDYP
jgi:hypothetical protein